MLKKIALLIVLALSFSPVAAEIISFDLDETLISSANMTRWDINKAKKLGYNVGKSKDGFKYVVRPGAEEILKYANDLGFEVMILTHNFGDYARDILASSGLDKYVTKVKSIEDLKLDYNEDFDTYPYHRNRTYKASKTTVQKTAGFFKRYTVGLYKGTLKRSALFLTGNTNIRPYLPAANTKKYPPIYGSRLHIDNSTYNVDAPLDFVGILVPDFDGTDLEPLEADGTASWIVPLKSILDYMKKYSWQDLYRREYHKDPIESKVKIISSIYLENFSKDFLDNSSISILRETSVTNNLNLCIG